jgi:hypothetical protein
VRTHEAAKLRRVLVCSDSVGDCLYWLRFRRFWLDARDGRQLDWEPARGAVHNLEPSHGIKRVGRVWAGYELRQTNLRRRGQLRYPTDQRPGRRDAPADDVSHACSRGLGF